MKRTITAVTTALLLLVSTSNSFVKASETTNSERTLRSTAYETINALDAEISQTGDEAEYTEGTKGLLSYRLYSDHVEITDCDMDTGSEITVPATIEEQPVTVIGDFAFQKCDNLRRIKLPDTVETCGVYAFQYCTSLRDINLPSGLTAISKGMFYHCDELYMLTIPDSVTEIRDYAFSCCLAMGSITIPAAVHSIGQYAFQNCYSLCSITIENPYCEIYDNGSTICSSNTTITDEEGKRWAKYLYYGTIYGYSGSTAQAYAEKNSYEFSSLGTFDAIKGDVNADGVFSVSDIIAMQKWLLKAGTLELWQNGDMNQDEQLDVFDLVLMKRELLKTSIR